MKTNILSSLFLLSVFVLNAQNINIQKGEEFKPEDGAKFNYYIGNNANGIFVQRTSTKGKGFTKIIQRIDPHTLQPTYTQSFELDKREESNGTYLIDAKILAFTNKYDKELQTKYLLMREYDALTGKEVGDVKQIFAISCNPTQAYSGSYYIVFSPDKTKMAIITEFKQNKDMGVDATIYNTKNYTKIGIKKVLESYKNSTLNSFNYRLDNNGEFYYLFYYMKDFDENIGGFALTATKTEFQKPNITELPLDNLDIKNGSFEFINNDIVFCGLYKDLVTKKDEKLGKTANVGFFSFFIDGKTFEIKNKGFDYFTPQVNEKLTYADGLIQKEPAKKFYSFENIFTFNENVYLIESHSYAISGNGYTSYERELIVSKFSKVGKLEWMRIIPKFTANGLNEFNFIVRNNKVYLFYAEHPKNIEKSTVEDYDPKKYHEIKNYNGSVLVCTSFDEKGNLSRKEMFRNMGWCYDPLSTNIIVDKDNGLILRMINRAEERYDKVTLD